MPVLLPIIAGYIANTGENILLTLLCLVLGIISLVVGFFLLLGMIVALQAIIYYIDVRFLHKIPPEPRPGPDDPNQLPSYVVEDLMKIKLKPRS